MRPVAFLLWQFSPHPASKIAKEVETGSTLLLTVVLTSFCELRPIQTANYVFEHPVMSMTRDSSNHTTLPGLQWLTQHKQCSTMVCYTVHTIMRSVWPIYCRELKMCTGSVVVKHKTCPHFFPVGR